MFQGYRCFRSDRGEGKRGGGVVLMVGEDVIAVVRGNITDRLF